MQNKAERDKQAKRKVLLEELAEKFRQLEVDDPELSATVEIDEGIPLLAKAYFLRLLWNAVVKEGDMKWIDFDIEYAEKNPDHPFIGGGLALKSLRAKGATDEELNDLVRNYQMEYLSEVISVLDYGRDPGGNPKHPWQEKIEWQLVEVDEEGRALSLLEGLNELVMGFDPTGRCCRVRGWVNK